MIAVLTGDIVGSQKMKPKDLQKLLKELLKFLEEQKNENYPGLLFEIYRGDSIQIALLQPEHTLKLAVLVRTFVISLTPEKEKNLYDIRISISIGIANPLNGSLGTSNGTAFVESGHGLDAMKKNERFVFNSQDKALNAIMSMGLIGISQIMSTWTLKRAKTMRRMLCGISRELICKDLGITLSTLSTSINGSSYYGLKKILDCTEQYIKMITEQDK